jgi:nucleotide-binding universal stress UspA family protein
MATTNPIEFGTLLVPTDFSAASETALTQAFSLAGGKKPVVILLHVIDPSLVNFAATHNFGSAAEVTQQMRLQALQDLKALKERFQDRAEIDTIACEGTPFVEILRKAEDFAVDAIVIGKVGARGAAEKLLFGSTAEKVVRGSRRPVLVLPIET